MKTVLITGATGGIGNALVHKFYDAGYNILATGTNNDKLNLLHDNFNERVKCVKCDLSDKNDINNLVEEANKSYQIIDILINNAGKTRDNLFIRMSDDDWDKVININLTANFRLTKLLIKGMIKNRWGRIINITSDAAKIGNPGQSNYVASKSAIEKLEKIGGSIQLKK